MSKCTSCEQKIDVFSFSLSAFPFYFKCPNCNVRLKLISSKFFWATVFLYLALIITLIFYVPILQEYNLAVILAVLGWFSVYYKVSSYILSKENLAIYS
ncbi:hypothetical protein B5D82_19565 [Cognaticolwellia beringensis]|uniref:Cxxc_20_cxxc protein n=1 Tax=Cognaticolwellia beringensis TaxID=1967665 RepID=A0A222GD38_9GAMM|nr:hypothetical protein B5D82_19565 [Cognaticolwellia beringensis]